jgi:hypothetical protein
MPLDAEHHDNLAKYISGKLARPDEDEMFEMALKNDELFDALVTAAFVRDIVHDYRLELENSPNRRFLWPPASIRWQSIRLDTRLWKDETTGVCSAFSHYV